MLAALLAADYPFLDIFWTMLIFFCWIIWFWLLITIFADIFRRHDTSGFTKVLWIIFVIIVPFLGVFIYLIANHDGMPERNMAQAQAQQAQTDAYVRSDRRKRRRRRRDREGEGPARLGRDHAGRVRRDQAEGARKRVATGRRPACRRSTTTMAGAATCRPSPSAAVETR